MARGYNWKARQGDVSQRERTAKGVSKRKRLSSKERKRLEKIIEVKELKKKRSSIINSLQLLKLPSAELNQLHHSTDLVKKGTNKRKGKWCTPKKSKRFNKDNNEIEEKEVDMSDISSDDEDQTISANADISVPVTDTTTTGETEACTTATDTATPTSVHVVTDATTATDTAIPTNVHVVTDATTATDNVTIPTSSNVTKTPAVYLSVNRTTEVQSSRLLLPILSEEHQILDLVQTNQTIVICGETGSGKTTQVPQFLYESGYTLRGDNGGHSVIGITQPRRVAAVTMSQRVAYEMNLSKREVSYQIRYEGTTTPDTAIKFMTDGVLLKEIEKDFLLSNYSVIIIDEAHERSVYTDILIGLLSRIVPLRHKNGRPLKLIIMSATLRVQDFTENRLLFLAPPPVIKVESRQYPVTVHFNRHTPNNYLVAAYQKVCKIHRNLPRGHILVFLTGKQEIHKLCKKLKQTFPGDCDGEGDGDICESEGSNRKFIKSKRGSVENVHKSVIDLNDYPIVPSAGILRDDIVDSDCSDDELIDESNELSFNVKSDPMLVLPLYSTLSNDQQIKVFQDVPSDVRLCVVATNVAETSITIPHIKYVVDSGKVKRKLYDQLTGVSTFHIDWISKASANQRSGRAGRTEPGHCYRLYSSSLFQHEFPEFSQPDIIQRPVDDLVLLMKAMNIVKVANFPFPTPPSFDAIKAADKLLVSLGAVDKDKLNITSLGSAMSSLPVAPRYSKMLCLSHQNGCLPYMVIVVATLSVRELFVTPDETTPALTGKLSSIKRTWAGQGEWLLLGDIMIMLRAVGGYESSTDQLSFCYKSGLRLKALKEIRKLRRQLINILNSLSTDNNLCIDPKMAPPTQEQARSLRQIILSGSVDHVARKIDTSSMNIEDKKKFLNAYECSLCDNLVYIHPSSSLINVLPQYVVFQELIETNKLYMRDVIAIEEEWLPRLLPQCCTFSKPLDTPPPSFDQSTGRVTCHMTSTFGPWKLSIQSFPYPQSLERYKWFGVYLLEGDVIPSLREFKSYLLSPPVTMVKSWAKLQKRTQLLLAKLVSKEVDDRDKLLSEWTKDPKFLLAEYSTWLPQNKHELLSQKWPPPIN